MLILPWCLFALDVRVQMLKKQHWTSVVFLWLLTKQAHKVLSGWSHFDVSTIFQKFENLLFLSNFGMATPLELSQICFYSFWNTRRSVDKLMANTGGISCNALAVKAGAWLWTTWCECKQTCPQLRFERLNVFTRPVCNFLQYHLLSAAVLSTSL